MAGNLTRILNNQIYSKTIIGSQKIADGTITGSLFSSNVTVPGDFLISGNLFVLGSSSYTTIASTNTYVNDPLVVLNNGFAGTNTYDEGLIFNRGSGTNQAFIWSEFFGEFRLIATSETGTTYGNVNGSGLVRLSVGSLNVLGQANIGSLSLSGGISAASLNVSGNVLAAAGVYNALTVNGNETVTGYLNVTGNVMAKEITGNSLNVTGNVSTALLNAGQINTTGNVLATAGTFNALTVNGNETVTGYLNVSGNVLTASLSAGQINTTGNVLAAAAVVNTLTVNGNETVTGYLNVSGNVLSAGAIHNNLTVNGNTSLGIAGAVSGSWTTVVGNITQSTSGGAVYFNTAGNVMAANGQFGAINSTGYINTSGNISTAQLNAGQINTTGNVLAAAAVVNALTVNGNESVTGYLNVSGNVLTAQLNAGQINTTGNVLAAGGVYNALTVNGNESVTGYLNVSGNVLASAIIGASLNVSGNVLGAAATFSSAQINGNESVTGYLNVAGNILGSAGTLTTLALNSTANATEGAGASGALQIKGGASIAQDLWVGGNVYAGNIIGISANVITVQDPLLYLRPNTVTPYNYDIGFYSAFQATGLGTINQYQHTGVFRDPLDNTWKFASNLAEPSASYITLDANSIYDPIKAGNLNLVNTTAATTTGTGALIVAGGAGIGGTVVAAQLNSTGNVLGQAGTFNALTVNGTTTLTGFLNSSANISAAIINAGAINSTGYINTSGNISTALLNAGQINTTGNVLAAGGVYNALTVNGTAGVTTLNATTITATGNVIGGLGQFAAINSTPIGNASASTGAFTTLNASGVTTLTGNLSLSGSSNIIAGGSPGVNGQVLQATGTGVQWVSLTASSSQIYSGGSNVTVTANYVNVSVNGTNVATFSSTGLNGAAIGASTSSTGKFTTLQATSTVTLNNYTGYVYSSGGGGISASTTIPNTNITGLGTMSTQDASSVTITGGSIDGASIGLSTAGSARFTSVTITDTTDTTAANTGAFQVQGGAYVGRTLWVGESAVFNSTQTAEDFRILGLGASTNNSLVYVNASKNAIVFGGANVSVQDGAVAKFNSDGAIVLPVGATARRPGTAGNVDVAGMIRFNTTINNVEFYDGSAWQTAGSSFTVISDRQFSGNVAGGYGNVDGTNKDFTLQSSATTSGTIVSINGILQFPTLAYSVSGTTLSFTEAPAPDDVIDARILTTTTTIASVASSNGLNQFIVDNTYANIQTGSATSTPRISVNNAGNISIPNGSPIIYNQSNIAAQGTNVKLLDSFSTATYGTAKYLIQIKDGSKIESAEVLLAQDTANISITTYAVLAPSGVLGTFSSNIVAGVANFWYTPTSSTYANIKVQTTYIV